MQILLNPCADLAWVTLWHFERAAGIVARFVVDRYDQAEKRHG